MLATEINTSDIPFLFTNFKQKIKEKHWLRQVKECKTAIRGNLLLKAYLQKEYEIAYQLSHMSDLAHQYGRIPPAYCMDRTIYPAVGFMAQVLSAIKQLAPADADRVLGRVKGAFKNPDDMRALRLELTAATHFLRRGKTVSWPEITGTGRFDLLVEGLGTGALEVECKSISADKGRKIHRREVLDFYALVKPKVTQTIAGLARGLFLVVTLPDRLPKTHGGRVDLAKSCCAAIFHRADQPLPDGTNLRVGEFPPQEIGVVAKNMNTAGYRVAIDRVTNTRNREVMVVGTEAGGVFVLVVQSAKDDVFLEAMFKSLGKAARDQVSGNRPALLVSGLNDVNDSGLRSIATDEGDIRKPPTALRVQVSQFLSSEVRHHIVGVAFFSGSSVSPKQEGVFDTGGISYYFAQPQSNFWHQDFNGMFNIL